MKREPNNTTGRVIVVARGLFCPVPIIRLSETMKNLDEGGIVELISDDPAIAFDVPAWCKSTGHKIISEEKSERDCIFFVQKKRGN